MWIARQQEGLAWEAAGERARAVAAFDEIIAARADRQPLPIYPDEALTRAAAQNRADILPSPGDC